MLFWSFNIYCLPSKKNEDAQPQTGDCLPFLPKMHVRLIINMPKILARTNLILARIGIFGIICRHFAGKYI